MNTLLRVLAAVVTPVILGAAFAIPTAAGAPQQPVSQAPLSVPGILDTSVLKTATHGPIVATGTLANAAGTATSGWVAALAMPGEQFNKSLKIGDRIPTPTVGWAAAGGDGAFTLRVDQNLFPRGYLSPTGQANLELIAWNGTTQTQWFTPAQVKSVVAAPTPINAKAPTRLNLRMKDAIVSAPRLSAKVPTVPYAGACVYILVGKYLVWDNVGESLPYTGSQTTSWFSIGTSHSLTVGAATSATGAYGTWRASGSYTTSAGVSITWPHTTADVTYRVQTQYAKVLNSCGFYLTYPLGPTGGNAVVAIAAPDWCNYGWEVPMSQGVTFTRNSSAGYDFNLSGGVLAKSVLGINLSLDSKYATDRSLSYHFLYPGYLCGSDSYPATAARMNEGSPSPQK
jgi:hypothetical protein